MNPTPNAGPDIRNLLLAIVGATLVMLAWQYFYERPRLAAANAAHAVQAERRAVAPMDNAKLPPSELPDTAASSGPRIKIDSPALHGSIALTGARFDDLTLADYHDTADKDAPEVKLLSVPGGIAAYFAEVGVLPGSDGLRVPDANTVWHADGHELTPTTPLTLTWNNGAGLTFEKKIAVDDHYMFTVTTTVKNSTGAAVTLYPYGLVSRNYDEAGTAAKKSRFGSFGDKGPLVVADHVLEDVTYKELREDGAKKFEHSRGWVGMTDKYWLTALVPAGDGTYDTELTHFKRNDQDAYQANMRGEALQVPAGGSADFTMHLFAGAKEVNQLDAYSAKYDIPLFDRAVNFGVLYFIAKPIFQLLNYFHGIVGNFGIAILLLTVCIKLLLFPLASKSMTAMARTKQLTPKVTEIREKHAGDKMKMNQEIMAMYKREKVNPVAGCLPILLQLPIFYALYRTLSVTIEMRQAPFFGWIRDLSAPDPTNVFTAFGYAPWDVPSFLHLGVWPMIMCVTMVIQQRLNPKPADEVQAMVMSYMPFMFLFLFAGFPAGLVIYWAWNNSLTILQQLYINHGLKKKGLK